MIQELVSEQQVLNILEHYAILAMEEAERDLGRRPNPSNKYALSFYRAAIRSETPRPSVVVVLGEGAPICLQSNTCPPTYSDMFERWAALVPEIQKLSQQDRNALHGLICNEGSAGQAPLTVERIAVSLAELGQDIHWEQRLSEDIYNPSYITGPLETSLPFPLGHSYSPVNPNPRLPNTPEPSHDKRFNPVISSHMPVSEVIGQLVRHGCMNVTNELDPDYFGKYANPVAGGGFGDVYRGMLGGKTPVAIKVLSRRMQNVDLEHKEIKRAALELYTWSKCDHPNIARFLGLAVFQGNIAMLSLWMEHGTVVDYIARNPNADRLELCYGTTAGVKYLHSKGIVHGGIKGKNILVSKEGGAVLTDFGDSILQDGSLEFTATITPAGISTRWAAPELFHDSPTASKGSDVYALGMTILVNTVIATIIQNKTPNRPYSEFPDHDAKKNLLWDLLTMCWSGNPKMRPTAEQVYHKLANARPMRELHDRRLPDDTGDLQKLQRLTAPDANTSDFPLESSQLTVSRSDEDSESSDTETFYSGSSELEDLIGVNSLSSSYVPSGNGDQEMDAGAIIGRRDEADSSIEINSPTAGEPSTELDNSTETEYRVGPGISSDANPPSEPIVLPETKANELITEVISCLTQHGCADITHKLDLSSCDDAPIAQGGLSDIYYGKLYDGTPVAIKTVRRRPEKSDEERKHLKRAAEELYVWAKCEHSYVVPLLGLAGFRGRVAMLSEWMDNGDLRSFVGKKTSASKIGSCVELAEALAYLHDRNIVHGDLKGSNVLISDKGSVRLTDFGNATLGNPTLRFTQTQTARNPSMTPRWAAPELFQEGRQSAGADVYAETYTCKHPYSGDTDPQFMFRIFKKEIPNRPAIEFPIDDGPGDALWRLLKRCWAYDPVMRPTARQVLEELREISKLGPEFRGQVAVLPRWMENGDLRSYVMDMCVQVAEALAYLHKTGLVHADLKGANVLVSRAEDMGFTDFGNAVFDEPTLLFAATATNQCMSAVAI
ncbi:kinase domain protein [Ceratobasidium sp. AG-Ba]|nr:kinase domain protein [Ceratobasidium sp. AG-Ba]